MTDCIFCKIIKQEIVSHFLYEDDKLVVFKDIHPRARVHLLVVPKQHIKSLMTMNEEHRDLLGDMLLVQNKLAELHKLDTGFRTIINTGIGGGQEIHHLHFHLLGGGSLPGM
jgi:histidine triad (HIT) family protein